MTSKTTWHTDRREKIGANTPLPATHPVSVKLREAGMWVGKCYKLPLWTAIPTHLRQLKTLLDGFKEAK